jgi:hypothetical protein
MCHKPARKEKTGRGRNGDKPLARITWTNHANESVGRVGDILWKTFPLSSEQAYYALPIVKNPEKYWLSCLFTVKHCAGMAGLRTSPAQNQAHDRAG